MSHKYLTTISKEESTAFINSFDEVLCDCDGVIYIMHEVFDGVKESVEILKKLGKKMKYVTNNPSISRNAIANVLTSHGIPANEDDVFNPSRAVVDYLKRINFNKKIYVISLSTLKKELKDAGIRVANTDQPELTEPNDESFLKCLKDLDPEVGAVLVCFDYNMTYINLDKATKYLKNPEVLFLTTGYSQKIIVGLNNFCLGPSYFHDLLTSVIGRSPICMGKPKEGFLNFIKDNIQSEPKRTLFIGDSLEEDMGFAKKLGFQKLLVFTGKTKIGDMLSCEEKNLPDYYIDSLLDFGKFIKQNIN